MEDLSAGWFAEQGLCTLWISIDPCHSRWKARAMRVPRMTTRRWMIAVAVMAVMLAAAAALFRRRLGLRERGDYHARRGGILTDRARGFEQLALKFADREPRITAEWRAYAACEAEIGAWHARLKEKYRHVARYPWLPIEPDPPEPENPFKSEGLPNIDLPSLP
jgi:hypothetical protein